MLLDIPGVLFERMWYLKTIRSLDYLNGMMHCIFVFPQHFLTRTDFIPVWVRCLYSVLLTYQ